MKVLPEFRKLFDQLPGNLSNGILFKEVGKLMRIVSSGLLKLLTPEIFWL